MEKIRIGILSDTHGLLREEVQNELSGCSAILHGGDINRQEIIDQLSRIAPVYAVRGNNDKEWAEHLPLFLDLRLYGMHIYMTHKKKDLPADLSEYDLVIVGHTHKYEMTSAGKTILLNPGSCGPRRFNQEITMAILTLEHSEIRPACSERSAADHGSGSGCIPGPEASFPEIHIQKINIPHAGKTSSLPDTDIHKTIVLAVKEIEKGSSSQQIAKKLKIDRELADQICRLYLTHPGVDADGIMTKMGL